MRFLKFLLSFFYRFKEPPQVSAAAWRQQSAVVPRPDKRTHSPKNARTLSKSDEKDAHIAQQALRNTQKINPESVIIQIKKNIFFLDSLSKQFEIEPQQYSYYVKIQELREQSQGSLKIMYRIKKEAPYYQQTLKMIYRHTRELSSLMEEG